MQNFGAFLERDQGCLVIDNALAPPAICNQAANVNPENKIASSAVSFLAFCYQANILYYYLNGFRNFATDQVKIFVFKYICGHDYK